MLLKKRLQVITDIAFDSEDFDCSGNLDIEELQSVLAKIAGQMGVSVPTNADVNEILKVLDRDYDGEVNKDEFLALVLHGIGNVLVLEEKLQDSINE